MKKEAIDEAEALKIKENIEGETGKLEAVMNNTAKVLSDTTHLTSVVLAPKINDLKINRLQIVDISGHRLVLVIVFNDGTVKDMTVPSHGWSEQELSEASEIISKKVKGKTLLEAYDILYKDIPEQYNEQKEILNTIVSKIRFDAESAKNGRIVLGGAKNILDHPEYKDVDSAKNFLQLLETKKPLYEMLSKATDMEFTIKIGKENDIEQLKNMSVVTATYKIGDKNIGSFGVIGPTRMDYAKVLSVLSCVGKSMSEIMGCYIQGDDKEDT